jgi:general secretion pathway protein J
VTVKRRRADSGFTMIEATAALALTALVVLTLSTIAGQWMPNWRRGFVGAQRADLLELGLERIAADLAAAEFVTVGADSPAPLFEGEPLSVTFVRSSIGPNSSPRLEVVRLAETVDGRGFALVRTAAPFAPTVSGRPPYDFADPVVLVRAPFRIAFAYAGPDRRWVDAWRGVNRLPDAVRVTVRDAASERVLAASTAVRLNVAAAPPRTLTPQADGAGAASPQPTPAPL